MSDYFIPLSKVRRERKRKQVARIFVFLLLGFLIFYMYTHFIKNTQGTTLGQSIKASPVESPKNSSTLQQVVAAALEGSQADYSVYIKNLKTGEQYFEDEHKSYESGSLYKLWVMGEAYDQIKNGELKEDDELSEDIPTLNQEFDIDPADAELTEGTIDLTVADALSQMITISHNYAALLLTEKLKLSQVKNYLEKNGFTESNVGTTGASPSTTAFDIAKFLEKLYKGELSSPEYTTKMLDLLKAQQLNNKLPLYLPKDAVVAHKTGEIGWFSHDAGIVYGDKGDYIIVVLSESENPAGAEDRIAQISKSVYQYFEGR